MKPPKISPADNMRLIYEVLSHGNIPISKFERLCRKYNGIFRVWLPSDGNVIIVSRPKFVSNILLKNQSNYSKSKSSRETLSEVFGYSLVTNEGEVWEKNNKRVSPIFNKDNIQTFFHIVYEETENIVSYWESTKAPYYLQQEFQRLVFNILGRLLFSTDFPDIKEDLLDCITNLQSNFASNSPSFWKRLIKRSHKDNPDIKKNKRKLEDNLQNLVRSRNENTTKYNDVLGQLINTQTKQIENRQIIDDVKTIIFAALESTATTLSWVIILLNQNQEIYQTLHKSLSTSHNASRKNYQYVSHSSLTYIIKEALRLYPPVALAPRIVNDDHWISNYYFPQGSKIIFNPRFTHRDPNIWENPTKFCPDRFEPENFDLKSQGSYYPFGLGKRTCLGKEFAMSIMSIIIKYIVNRYRIEFTNNDRNIGVSQGITMTPDKNLKITIKSW